MENDWLVDYKERDFRREDISKPVFGNAWKVLYLKLGAIILLAIVFVTLINLAIVNGATYSKEANANRIYIEPIIAPRGIIYDRNAVPLVYNTEVSNVIAGPQLATDTGKDTILSKLAGILNVSTASLESAYAKGSKEGDFVELASNISKDQMIEITASPYLSYITVEEGLERTYPYKNVLAQVLGYTGGASAADLEANPVLNAEDTIGKTGIEYEYDNDLRGIDGERIVEVNTLGNVVSTIKTENPVPGENIYLSIDVNVQQTLATDLQKGIDESKVIGGYNSQATGGAAIIEDTTDGSILALVSLPTYDNNSFADGISEQDYANLVNNPNDPLIDRAISEAQPPGSVMKTITASAALQEKSIDPSTIFVDHGTFQYGGHTYQDYDKIARGPLTVTGGLQWSSNIFFYNTILSLGIEKFLLYENKFGVGQLTGIDLPGEVTGQPSSPQVKQEETGQPWYGGDSLNAAIGQGYTEVTPIQVVNWITSIANGGTLFTPHIIEKVNNPDNSPAETYTAHVVRQGFVSSSVLDTVKQGMYDAVHSGIDITLNSPAVSIGGKTGTAEFGSVDSAGNYTHAHAWATGFAPFNNPQISFVSFVENGGYSTTAEFVSKTFLTWFFGSYLPKHPGML